MGDFFPIDFVLTHEFEVYDQSDRALAKIQITEVVKKSESWDHLKASDGPAEAHNRVIKSETERFNVDCSYYEGISMQNPEAEAIQSILDKINEFPTLEKKEGDLDVQDKDFKKDLAVEFSKHNLKIKFDDA
jgi:hypothetical protein